MDTTRVYKSIHVQASRTAIHLMFKRPPLCRVLASRMDADGRLVVERRSSSPAKEEEDWRTSMRPDHV